MTGWRLERSVTLGVVFALVMQTGGALIWAGAASERLDRLEAEAALYATASERLARLEVQIQQARESLSRIERRLDARD
ncbi:hypothetical protein V0U79_11805 [Hyphobacterium sp. HN65]|uniref:Uncharacterized protein n=1 Tax=Hyphobacterium lacteum TaxID=3116575 RepID=A0ABU7LUP3_9PROT|nr:hypothetical protein [Hyphobacterium sp. HN65]MEE2527054.1 hypothetical protein [Hyphobacterium sp. HN65]